ncbi:LPS-assembly lipoprotein [Oceanicella actignis]|nr:LPS-assembly lipoprotein [Oceanicella actignis]
MSCSERRRLCAALLAAATLGACGFAPMNRAGSGPARALGAIALDVPTDRLGFALREALERRLGRAAPDAPLRLTAELSFSSSGLAITDDNSITRYVLRGRSRYILTGGEDFAPVSGFVEAVTAYSATGSLFATRAAERDAQERLARELGERIADRVLAELSRRAQT